MEEASETDFFTLFEGFVKVDFCAEWDAADFFEVGEEVFVVVGSFPCYVAEYPDFGGDAEDCSGFFVEDWGEEG